MTINDEEFIRKLRSTFDVEAEEHLQTISSMLLELEKPASDSATLIENVYREVHSLKGAARAVDLADIEVLCQPLESVLSNWKHGKTTPGAGAFDVCHRFVDMVRLILASPNARSEPGLNRQYEQLINDLNGLLLNSKIGDAIPRPRVAPPVVSAPPMEGSEIERAAPDTVRISIAKLDARLLQAEDMLSVKSITVQRAVELRELAGQFEQWRARWVRFNDERRHHAQSAAAVDSFGDIGKFLEENGDSLRMFGNKLNQAAAQADQDRHHIGKRVDDLLEESKKLLMLPFSTLAGGFPKLVRDLCRDQGKEADFTVRGAEVEIDKRILEEMKDALVHVLRNSVDHGVESPDQRVDAGKERRAKIAIEVTPVNGSKVEIAVLDDGAGVDVERVKQSAVAHGVISDAEAGNLGESEALSLIFHSEVSTSRSVTPISGRGLGMAIASAKVQKLGGRIAIQSMRGSGTQLRMLLPLTLATFRGVLVTAAGHDFILPVVNVERVLRVRPDEVKTVENRESILVQGRIVSLARMAQVLELPPDKSAPDNSSTICVLLLQSADQSIAFAVDLVHHEEEVLVKPLRKPLTRVRNIAGATILGSGRVILVLNIADLIKSARLSGAAPQHVVPAPATSTKIKPQILVVEDSVTSRMLLKGILESAGYEVKTAVDGIDAYAALREAAFDLVVSDVEMPRMNGFDLTSRIRSDKRLAELPVVLVTALESREQRERGIDAGANAYIIKSSFDQSNLLEAIKRLI